MAVARPAYNTLKKNIKTILQEVATAEAIASPSRAFTVERDRWRPWIENQRSTALVNIMVDSVNPTPGGGTRQYQPQHVNVNIDMYVLGTDQDQVSSTGAVTLVPCDEVAADRLDLLIAQVQFGITRMLQHDFGFTAGLIGRSNAPSLTLYPQEGDQETGNYAPARWSLAVDLPYYPVDDGTTVALTELNISFDADEPWGLKYLYGD
jgi:hypothetical protein